MIETPYLLDLRSAHTRRHLPRLVADYGHHLPEQHLDLLRARYMAGVSGPRIARARGISKQTVYERLHKAIWELFVFVPEDDPVRSSSEAHRASRKASTPDRPSSRSKGW